MTLTTEFCDREYREVTRTYAATFEDVIWCIRNSSTVIIEGRGESVAGKFTHYDENGFYFVNDTVGFYVGHDYNEYLEVVDSGGL